MDDRRDAETYFAQAAMLARRSQRAVMQSRALRARMMAMRALLRNAASFAPAREGERSG